VRDNTRDGGTLAHLSRSSVTSNGVHSKTISPGDGGDRGLRPDNGIEKILSGSH
jgi:hypothetical protein